MIKEKEDKKMKKFLNKFVSLSITAISVISVFAVIVSANNVASPICGQAIPPKNLKKYRKF